MQPVMSAAIKLSSPATREFWEIPVLYEDEQHLLALDKPLGLAGGPEQSDPERPTLLQLLHAAIAEGKPWARERGLSYLMAAHRLEAEASGVLLLAKSKAVLSTLLNWAGSGAPGRKFVALATGTPAGDKFTIEAKIAPHQQRPGLMRVDSQRGKRSCTECRVLERFSGYALLECETLTDRLHQVRVHLRYARLAVAGDTVYGGRPLLLSKLKPHFRLKPNREERPLLGRPAVHASELTVPHPVSGQSVTISAPWPKDMRVALKYLRMYAAAEPSLEARSAAEEGEGSGDDSADESLPS
jgi:RluA family pseudouridine synthase